MIELNYKDLQTKPRASMVDAMIDAIPVCMSTIAAVVFVLFGADALQGAMMLMGY